jgi:hypothetical protein
MLQLYGLQANALSVSCWWVFVRDSPAGAYPEEFSKNYCI